VNANPRTRYAAAVHRACVDGNLPLVRRLFAEASGEVFTLRGLLAREDEIVLGRVLAARYLAGASLLALSAEIGRSTQYVAKVPRLAGATQPDAWMARASPFFSLPQSELRYPAAKTGPASDRAGVSGGPLRGGR